jgi:hypothetical protein
MRVPILYPWYDRDPQNSCKAELNCRVGMCNSKARMSYKRNVEGLNGTKGVRALG